MNAGETLIILALVIPLFGAAATYAVGRFPDVRETLTFVTTLALVTVTITLALRTGQGDAPELVLLRPLEGLEIAFRLEPLGALFAVMASVLWSINSLFAFAYMRGKKESNQTRFYMCFALAMFGVMGAAMAANLFTLFIFYEVLTLSTYPLVAHKGDEKARKAGRFYLLMLVGASVVFFLPGVIGVHVLAGSTDFVEGGVLAGRAGPWAAGLVLALIVFGVAKAALIPMHAWLPTAMVAPTPVSAMLHAVAVVKAGVFTLLKASVYIFGQSTLDSTPVTQWLLWLAAATIVIASLVAMTKDELKARLAWSTIGQLAYVTSGALLAVSAGVTGGGLHMLAHAFGKITLFMCAGAIFVGAGLTRVSQLRGLGWRMPLVFIAFLIGAASVIGLPPTGGMWSKFLLVTAAFSADQPWTAWAMIASSILSAAYLLPIGILAFASAPPKPGQAGPGAPRLAVFALSLTAIGTLALFLLSDAILAYLQPLPGGAP
jgi:multicomponent Na+:H+ antiporter subunit D